MYSTVNKRSVAEGLKETPETETPETETQADMADADIFLVPFKCRSIQPDSARCQVSASVRWHPKRSANEKSNKRTSVERFAKVNMQGSTHQANA